MIRNNHWGKTPEKKGVDMTPNRLLKFLVNFYQKTNYKKNSSKAKIVCG